MFEEPERSLSQLQKEEQQYSTAKSFIETEEAPYKGVNFPGGEVGRAVCELDRCYTGQDKFYVSSENVPTNRFDKKENINHKKSCNSTSCVLDDRVFDDRVKKLLVNGHPLSNSLEKIKHQEATEITDNDKLSNDQSSKLLTTGNDSISTKRQRSKESFNGQVIQNRDTKSEEVKANRRSYNLGYFTAKLSEAYTDANKIYDLGYFTGKLSEAYKDANRSYNLGYFTGKLSEAYKDAGKRLQDTRDVIRNVQVDEMKVVLFQYVTKMSKELPLFHQMQTKLVPESCIVSEKVILSDPTKDCCLSLPLNCSMSEIPGVSGWPEGSVLSLKNTCPEVFNQRLVQLPPAFSQLQSLSSQKILEKLEFLAPEIKVNKLLSVFWLRTACRKEPVPKPGCLLLSEKDIVVLASKTNSLDTPAVFHHFKLKAIKTVQISLAGQHVRLIGCNEEIVLAVFTYSKELTQELCKSLLKALSPEDLREGIKDHPLLSGDLMVLSLDWASSIPDIVLDNGLQVSSRFKRVLADLLYIVHGNMDGPGKPSLANVCPLLYTSVKVMNSTSVHPNDIFQFLLTDTHIALLREDGVFHPMPRGSSLVPAQPQFQGLKLRKRSEITCAFVRQIDDWLVVDIAFTTRQSQTREKAQFRRRSIDVPSVSYHSHQCDSWKLSFGCTSEAVTLINHLCI